MFSHNNDEKTAIKFFEANPLKNEDGELITHVDLLRFINYASKRRTIDDKFTADVIKKMPNAGVEKNWLTKLLKRTLGRKENAALAFKGEGLEELYKKAPYPINKVTVMDGEAKNKIALHNYLLEGVAGVNQYFVVEIKTETDKKSREDKVVRKYSTPNFLDCIERLAKGLPVHDESPGSKYITLSPGDLVYVPKENDNTSQIDWSDKEQLQAGFT